LILMHIITVEDATLSQRAKTHRSRAGTLTVVSQLQLLQGMLFIVTTRKAAFKSRIKVRLEALR
jgi:hypothetical protein